jgi:hypothetical protein
MLRISQPRIISFVRLLGKLGIFRPLLEYCTLRRGGLGYITDRLLAPGIADKDAVVKIGIGIPRQDSPGLLSFLTLRGSFSASPHSSTANTFSVYSKHRATSSVIAVSRANGSLVVLCEGFGQGAGLAR